MHLNCFGLLEPGLPQAQGTVSVARQDWCFGSGVFLEKLKVL